MMIVLIMPSVFIVSGWTYSMYLLVLFLLEDKEKKTVKPWDRSGRHEIDQGDMRSIRATWDRSGRHGKGSLQQVETLHFFIYRGLRTLVQVKFCVLIYCMPPVILIFLMAQN